MNLNKRLGLEKHIQQPQLQQQQREAALALLQGEALKMWGDKSDVTVEGIRCIPKLSKKLQEKLVSMVPTVTVPGTNTHLPLTAYLQGSDQRLRRYIGDIQKGYLIIIIAGTCTCFKPPCLRPRVRERYPLSGTSPPRQELSQATPNRKTVWDSSKWLEDLCHVIQTRVLRDAKATGAV